jgi:uncharacterized protein with HEPN domain
MKNTEQLLRDLLDAVDAIQSYSLPTFNEFLKDEKTQDAIMYNLIIMGEAANRISRDYQDAHPEIPWSSIIGTRNVIVHGYDQVKLKVVWDIVHKDITPLRENLVKILGKS